MHFHSTRRKTSPFLTFPIDTAATRLETRKTKTSRKQSTTPRRPPRKKTRTLRYAFRQIFCKGRSPAASGICQWFLLRFGCGSKWNTIAVGCLDHGIKPNCQTRLLVLINFQISCLESWRREFERRRGRESDRPRAIMLKWKAVSSNTGDKMWQAGLKYV